MKHYFVIALLVLSCTTATAQQPSVNEMYQAAKTYMQQGDYENADIAFKNFLKIEPENIDALKDYAYLNCLRREYPRAIAIGKFLTERRNADVQSYQLLGMAYKGSKDYVTANKLYQTALKKYPNSGVLYNDYGELLAMDNNLSASIQAWEAGINKDPNNANNYYNAIMFYDRFDSNVLWRVLYSEIFVNLESYTQRTAEVKGILLDCYKKLFSEYDLDKAKTDIKSNVFERGFLSTLNNSKSLSATGITPENLSAIRSRFILDWFEDDNLQNQSYQLFQHHQYLLREGMFEAYNQWLFGPAFSPSAYQLWLNTHEKEATAYKQYQQNKVFKLAAK